MRTYVINLRESTDRRERTEAQLRAAGLDYTLVEAVNGRHLSPAERAELVDEEAVARAPGWLTPGAIGCALSHRAVYRRFLEAGDDVALVLEDDVRLPPDAASLLPRLATAVRPDEIVLLNFRSFKPARLSRDGAVTFPDGYSVLTPLEPRQLLASLAYFAGRDAAASLAAAIVPVRLAADSWGAYCERGIISVRCVFPRPVEHDALLESTLGYSETSVTGRIDALRHAWPVRKLRSANRLRLRHRMSRVELLD